MIPSGWAFYLWFQNGTCRNSRAAASETSDVTSSQTAISSLISACSSAPTFNLLSYTIFTINLCPATTFIFVHNLCGSAGKVGFNIISPSISLSTYATSSVSCLYHPDFLSQCQAVISILPRGLGFPPKQLWESQCRSTRRLCSIIL